MLTPPIDFLLMRLEEFETLLHLLIFAQLLIVISHQSPNIFHFKIKRTFKNFRWITKENTTSFVEKFNRNSATTDGVGKICEERVGGDVTLVVFHAFAAFIPLHTIRPLTHLKGVHLLLFVEAALVEAFSAHWFGAHFENRRQQLLVQIILMFLPINVQQVPT